MPRLSHRFFKILVPVTVILIALVAASVHSQLGVPRGRTAEPRPRTTRPLSDDGTASQQLAQARSAIVDGDVDTGITMLKALVGVNDPAVDAQARLLLGRTLLDQGQARAALDALSALRRAYPASSEANLAQFFQARAEEATGDRKRAVADYRAFAARNPATAPYVRLLAAAALQQDKLFNDAQSEAQAVATMPVIRRTAIDALERVRSIQQQRGDVAGTIDTTNRLLDLATLPSYRVELLYQRGQERQVLGNKDEAAADYLAVVANEPEGSYASKALAGLHALGQDDRVSMTERGVITYGAGKYAQAVDLLGTALAANADDDRAWYYRALSRIGTDDAVAAVELRGLADRWPESAYAAAALARAGKLFEDQQKPDLARSADELLVSRYPNAPEADESRFRLGFLAYMSGDFAGAASGWQATPASSDVYAQAQLWLGKALDRMGQAAQARAAWTAARDAAPSSYEGLRAAALLNGEGDGVAGTQQLDASALEPAPADRQAEDAWYRGYGADPAAVRGAVATDPSVQAILGLLDLDLEQQAEWEIDAFIDRSGDHLPPIAALGELLAARSDFEAALHVGIQLDNVARERHVALPRLVARLDFPIRYPDLVLRDSAKHGVDPLLLVALIRQESLFNPAARSSADARGLTQMLPSTGQEIADNLGRSDWQPNDLYRPGVSIDFGLYYLADQLRTYDGRLVPSLAAYNAGGGAVSKWEATFGTTDPDVFIERIPYPETYDYVRRVYANYLNYQRLYR